MIPQVIGRYQIRGQLGQGGMATVYRAYDPNFAREVAIKVLPPHFLHEPTFLKRFRQEAQMIAALEHFAVVPVYDSGEHNGLPFLVMRLMTGGSLADRLKKGVLSLAEAAHILAALAPTLDEAHRQGIIHRDLKPGNILFNQQNEPRIADFGIAKLTQATQSFTTDSIIGTAKYMSPEQWEGVPLDGRCDVYALGVILFQMLTGECPYSGTTPVSIMAKHVMTPVPNILSFREDLPPAIQPIIEQAMCKERDNRYPTASAFSQSLEQLLLGEGVGGMGRAGEWASGRPQARSGSRSASSTTRLLAPSPPLSSEARHPLAPSPPRQSQASTPKWTLGALGVLALTVVSLLIMIAVGLSGDNNPPVEPAIVQTTIEATILPMEATNEAMISEKDGMTLLYVPEGEFEMGSAEDDPDADAHEKPRHTVNLTAFWIDRTEVTNAMFASFVAETGHQTEAEKEGSGYIYTSSGWERVNGADWQHPQGPESDLTGLERHPVVQVSWNDATAYCEWAGRRLPTEAEWEKAAGGTDSRKYPWGNDAPSGDLLNFCDQNCPFEHKDASTNDGYQFSSPVGSYPAGASPYGALDMAGNVWESVNDSWAEYYASSPKDNPQGATSQMDKVFRGGSWNSTMRNSRARFRDQIDAGVSDEDRGFRCATSEN